MVSPNNEFLIPEHFDITNSRHRAWYYREYRKSEHWRYRRHLAIVIAGGRCENRPCTRMATEVHHLSYDNLYCEPNQDLMALCRPCHEWMHKWPANDNVQQLMLTLEHPNNDNLPEDHPRKVKKPA